MKSCEESGRRKSTVTKPDLSYAYVVLHLRGALWMGNRTSLEGVQAPDTFFKSGILKYSNIVWAWKWQISMNPAVDLIEIALIFACQYAVSDEEIQ